MDATGCISVLQRITLAAGYRALFLAAGVALCGSALICWGYFRTPRGK